MKMRRRVSRARRWLEIFLLLTGLTGVGIWGWSRACMAIYQQQANRALERKIHTLNVPRATPRLSEGALIGRLVIPRLNLQAVVREGAGADTLDLALGHIPGTAMPGQPGNVGVAGHRDTLFRGLRNIQQNDVIEFQTPSGSYNYQVESTSIVTPKDVSVLRAGDHPEMTLVTCYPFYFVGSAPDRFIVKARLIQTPAAAPPAPTVSATAKPPAPKRAHPAVRKVSFRVPRRQSREVAPGIRVSLSPSNTSGRRANGWIYVAQEGRTIWLHNLAVSQPMMFHKRELMLTSVSRDSVAGYLLLYP